MAAFVFILLYGLKNFYYLERYYYQSKINFKINSKDLSTYVITEDYGKFDINSITKDELESLPHISHRLAESIVNFRAENGNFVYVEDLMYVKGIGDKTFNKIKDYFYIK